MDPRLVALKQKLAEYDCKLDDPKGDGSGDDAVSPTGDNYNDLHAEVTLTLLQIETDDADLEPNEYKCVRGHNIECSICADNPIPAVTGTPVPATFDLTPRGYTVPGGTQRITAAMRDWEQATEVLANIAQQYVEMGDMGNSQELYKALEACINVRKEKVEALVKAVIGR